MATVNGVNYTITAAITAGTKGVADQIKNSLGANVKSIIDTYTFAGQAAGTVVNLGTVPSGAKVLGFVITYGALGAAVTGTIKVGSTSAAPTVTSMVAAGTQVIGYIGGNTALTADSIVSLTTADQAATGQVTLVTLYAQD